MKKLTGFLVTDLLILIFVALDQATKYLAETYISEKIPLIENFLTLEKSHNPGIAFGIHVNQIALLVITILLIAVLIHIAYKEINLRKTLGILSVGLILGGAIGNLIDRIHYGHVIDFISFKFWPAFNLADLFIVTGVLMVVIFYKRVVKK
ncbi:signal peptidase II [Candidatus Peregrinibacteria bacterium]|jgi:signal peptidase II|nr:signal peptidase II [Candidatus Peregrinibacteria bacterium]MBT4055904.1 signal peptidase II [Candidatus Peregrinibacteria bacterium]